MAALVDSAALLTYRAAWLRDCVGTASPCPGTGLHRASRDGEDDGHRKRAARDRHGAADCMAGCGVKVGTKVESLYRDIRSLRIYEGATEVQQLIIGKSVLQE
jgi:acyl-CoA dehydrogenase